MTVWIFEVKQDGMVVASGTTSDRDTALREAGHYTMMYGQDGPAMAVVRQATEADLKSLFEDEET